MNGVEGAYSHLVNAVLEGAGCGGTTTSNFRGEKEDVRRSHLPYLSNISSTVSAISRIQMLCFCSNYIFANYSAHASMF